MREQFLSASPMPHSLGTFLAEQESTAPGREIMEEIYAKFSQMKFAGKDLAIFIIIRYNSIAFEKEERGGRYEIRLR